MPFRGEHCKTVKAAAEIALLSIAQEPSECCGRSKTSPAHSTGLESKTISGGGNSFSLDFPFYRTGQRGDHRVSALLGRLQVFLEQGFPRFKPLAERDEESLLVRQTSIVHQHHVNSADDSVSPRLGNHPKSGVELS